MAPSAGGGGGAGRRGRRSGSGARFPGVLILENILPAV